MIATAGGGRYFELDRESDRDIANAIIDATRRRADAGDVEETTRELYWSALLMAAAVPRARCALSPRPRVARAAARDRGGDPVVLARVS